jgi:hypothetical protein
MPRKMERKPHHAYKILNELVVDLVTGSRSASLLQALGFKAKVSGPILVGFNRMCLAHLVLSLSKWIEFYKLYKGIIPSHLKDHVKALNGKLNVKQIQDFRNKAVGHIHDGHTGEPLTKTKIDELLENIVGTNDDAFLKWINNPTEKGRLDTVVGLCEALRSAIAKEYKLDTEEALNW